MCTVNAMALDRLNEALHNLCAATAGGSGRTGLAVAFSGGLDSRFLAFAAHMLGYAVTLFHVTGPHVSPQESAFALSWAQCHDLPLVALSVDPLVDERIAANHERRCYFCKKRLFNELLRASAPLPLCDGTHASDAAGYRPGRIALRELGIHSPLETAAFRKEDIRRIGTDIGLDMPWQKARPCLLTRFPYGVRANAPLLKVLAEAEEGLAEIIARHAREAGIPCGEEPDFRIRIRAVTAAGADVELHVQRKIGDFTQGEKLMDECRALFDAASPLHLLAVRHLENLSGYFDQNRASIAES